MADHVFIIAEAGVNHNGNSALAFDLIDIAARAGANAVKFQTFVAEELVTKTTPKAEYQVVNTLDDGSQFEMLKKLELSRDIYAELQSHCLRKNIQFMSTAFDSSSLKFLVHDLKLKKLKIPSGEVTNGPLLLEYARSGCDLILSTGMSSLKEVEEALNVLAYGLLNEFDGNEKLSARSFSETFSSPAGKQILKKKVTLLHCTSDYPAIYRDINLNAMITMRNYFGLHVGYSDHSEGISIPIAAAALGATVIEKHFTIDKKMSGPDHKASLDPKELKDMVLSIRNVHAALGDGVKVAMPSELKNIDVVRKSLVASRDLKAGETFSPEMLKIKRPALGLSPMHYWDILGTTVNSDYSKDELIK